MREDLTEIPVPVLIEKTTELRDKLEATPEGAKRYEEIRKELACYTFELMSRTKEGEL